MGITENLGLVRAKVAETASRAGRDPAGVTIVAVSKTVEADVIRDLHVASGHAIFGENRPQVLRDKAKELSSLPIRWHFIGQLQTNKIKYVYPIAELIHSVDRIDLLDSFADWARKTGRRCPCLLEVHISDEPSKNGFACDEVLDLIRRFRGCPDLDIRGMMGMAPFVADPGIIRGAFRRLFELFKASRELEGISYHALELSMGMTDDYSIAIEEGATMVRVGRALFRDRS